MKKGSVVMLILRRRWEYWVCATALHKLGAILIPGTLQLTKKDIVYRGNAAQVCAIVCVNDPFVIQQVEAAQPDIPSLKNKILVVEKREGWLDLNEEMEKFSDAFPRPTGEEATRWDDTMLVYFTSGTTGMPKMVQHNFSYPPGATCHRQVLAAGGGEQAAHERLRLWLGQVRLGQDLRPVGLRRVIFCYDMEAKFNPATCWSTWKSTR